MTREDHFFSKGWVKFDHDPTITAWVDAAVPRARACLADPEMRAKWLRCGGTWFAGVNVLGNDTRGRVDGGPLLDGAPIEFVRDHLDLDRFAWDPGQISVCFPGYPQPWDGESETAFRFRQDKDAAHVDGLARILPGRRRKLSEAHGFILGLPLTATSPDAAPLVVYEGSHEIIRDALNKRLKRVPPRAWASEDITDAYVAARQRVFAECRRVRVIALPGESYLIHRLAVHGIAKWDAPMDAAQRMIAYFRPKPMLETEPGWWLARR